MTVVLAVTESDITLRPADTLSHSHPFEAPELSIKSGSDTLIAIERASEILRSNDVSPIIAFPTETVYGLGADARRSDAVRAIYHAKNRPADNPLIVHVGSLQQLRRLLFSQDVKQAILHNNDPKPDTASNPVSLSTTRQPLSDPIPSIYYPLIEKFWPGALTIILPLPSNSIVSPLTTAGQSTLAVRLPSNPIAIALLLHSDIPLAAPSANASTRPSPTLARHVLHDLDGKIPLILDGGHVCDIGVESTVVDGLMRPPVVLRPGGISLEEIHALGGVWADTVVYRKAQQDQDMDFVPRTPGMKYRHYSPNAKVALFEGYHDIEQSHLLQVLDDLCPGVEQRTNSVGVMSSMSWQRPEFSCEYRELGRSGEQISQALFRTVRDLDGQGCKVILLEGVQDDQRGLAIMNRCRKMATKIYTESDRL